MFRGINYGPVFFCLGGFIGALLAFAEFVDFWGTRARGQIRCIDRSSACVGEESKSIGFLGYPYSQAKIFNVRCNNRDAGGLESVVLGQCGDARYTLSLKYRNTVYDVDVANGTIIRIIAMPIVF